MKNERKSLNKMLGLKQKIVTLFGSFFVDFRNKNH